MKKLILVCLLASAALSAQQVPGATELPGSPFFIKKTWIIGGGANWDYLTVDPAAHRLFIAHGPIVQVVDIETGTVAGQVTGLQEAHAIALDDTGQFGYISDGGDDQVKVFDRQTFAVVASIPTGPTPRALVFDPQNKLVFAICLNSIVEDPNQTPSGRPGSRNPNTPPRSASPNRTPEPVTERSSVTVIDAQTNQALAEILLPGRLGFAQTDGDGQVFINVVNRNQILRLDAQSLASLLHSSSTQTAAASTTAASGPAAPQVLDWSHESNLPAAAQSRMRVFSLGPDCHEPSGLATDSNHARLFAACNNMKMAVLNAGTGEVVTSLPTGPGTDAIGYDPNRGLIYTANGGANGSLTIIRQDVTDTYAVIQNLPTRQRARTLAVNPSTGEVYLVTDLVGFNLTQPGGIGTLKPAPVSGSFQVLVIAN
jgi:DNA-binding beta-propeller fold protein YncE